MKPKENYWNPTGLPALRMAAAEPLVMLAVAYGWRTGPIKGGLTGFAMP